MSALLGAYGSDDGSDDGSKETRLAPGWEAQLDPSSGAEYYWNRVSGVTSWEKPVAEHVEKPEPEHVESVETAESLVARVVAEAVEAQREEVIEASIP